MCTKDSQLVHNECIDKNQSQGKCDYPPLCYHAFNVGRYGRTRGCLAIGCQDDILVWLSEGRWMDG